MLLLRAFALASALSLLGFAQVLAAPGTEPSRSGITDAGVLASVAQVGGDDTFATADLTTAMASPMGANGTQHDGPFAGSSTDSGHRDRHADFPGSELCGGAQPP